MSSQENLGKIEIFKPKGANVTFGVRLKEETVWLTQLQMSELFGVERSVITKHLRNIFESRELEQKSNVQKMHIAHSDKSVEKDTMIKVILNLLV